MKYRKKPVKCEIDAMQFRRDNIEEFRAWCEGNFFNLTIPKCIGGIMTGNLYVFDDACKNIIESDYIIKDNYDDELIFTIYDASDFEEKFELAE